MSLRFSSTSQPARAIVEGNNSFFLVVAMIYTCQVGRNYEIYSNRAAMYAVRLYVQLWV